MRGALADKQPLALPAAQITLEITLDSGLEATYEVEPGLGEQGAAVLSESLFIHADGVTKSFYRCEWGKVVVAATKFMPPAAKDRLYLGRASDVPEFRPVYDALTSSAFYNFVPEVMRKHSRASRAYLCCLAMVRTSRQSMDCIGRLDPEARDRLLPTFP